MRKMMSNRDIYPLRYAFGGDKCNSDTPNTCMRSLRFCTNAKHHEIVIDPKFDDGFNPNGCVFWTPDNWKFCAKERANDSYLCVDCKQRTMLSIIDQSIKSGLATTQTVRNDLALNRLSMEQSLIGKDITLVYDHE